jgi:pimeloyl-ACP methyl ester carboxylesterase
MPVVEIDTVLHVDGVALPGTVMQPPGEAAPRGLVIFVHGSGSSRLSPRNREVAVALVERGLSTLLFDLLTAEEARDRRNVFDIPMLARRVALVTRHMRAQQAFARAPIGYFGASTGAAAALVAAADLKDDIAAVVSRGGRPDLAAGALPSVLAPTLLIVGSLDAQVLDLNRQAQSHMTCQTRLQVIPGATHLFEEPGTLEQVTHHAGEWFEMHFDRLRYPL